MGNVPCSTNLDGRKCRLNSGLAAGLRHADLGEFHLDLHLRIGFAGPVYAEFAVNLPNRIVFVRRIGLA